MNVVIYLNVDGNLVLVAGDPANDDELVVSVILPAPPVSVAA